MKASKTTVELFLSLANTQFVIPVYQRNYNWTTEQCKQLFNDILEIGANLKKDSHFIGSIVYVEDGIHITSDIREFTIIDGQQRLITLTLLYLVSYRIAKELNDEKLASKIYKTYLINEFAPEEENLKVRPTDNNNEALKHLFRNDKHEDYEGFSRIIENFNYLKNKVNNNNYQCVIDGLKRLMFVEIGLEQEDNPQKIFESLNSTGLELSEGDLIRNYVLMKLKRKEQEKIYNKYWSPIEESAKNETKNISYVSNFIRDYLTLENKIIPNQKKVYLEFKSKYPRLTVENLEIILSKLKSLAKHYNKLINPENEPDKEIRSQLKYINHLEINVAYPFLMKVYEDYSNSIINKSIFIAILELIQSFVWRRFILGLPTNSLNKIFMSLYDKVEPKQYLFSIQKSLLERSGAQRFPKNEETLKALKEKDVYNIKPKNRRYLLEKIENFENPETVIIDDKITIEHIFPQNPDPKWKEDLDLNEYNFIKKNYVNTIGNLTLSGSNAKLGNKSFKEKQDLLKYGYKESRFWLNKYLANAEKWGKREIEERLNLIAERFLKVWEIPDIAIEENVSSDEVNIFEAEDPKYKKLEYAMFLSEKLEIREITKLYVEVFKKLFELQPETFFTSEIGGKIGLTKNLKENNLRQPIAISDTYFIEGNFVNTQKFDRIKLALTLFDKEDELMIKYAED